MSIKHGHTGVKFFYPLFVTSDNVFFIVGCSNSFGEQKSNIFLISTDLNGNVEDCETCKTIKSLPTLEFSNETTTPTNFYKSKSSPSLSTTDFIPELIEPEYKVKNIWDGIRKTFVVTKSGKVGIGTETPTHDLQVNGTISSLASYETSDIRFKKDLNPIENALQNIDKATGYRFNLIIVQMNIQK